MDLVEKMIFKKGSINLSDLQMIKFQIEMDKPSIDYHNKSLTVSPLSSKSIQNYIEQQNRIKNDQLHLWNDSKMNSSKKNNFFAYIINPQKDDKKGKIIIDIYILNRNCVNHIRTEELVQLKRMKHAKY